MFLKNINMALSTNGDYEIQQSDTISDTSSQTSVSVKDAADETRELVGTVYKDTKPWERPWPCDIMSRVDL